MRSLLSFLMMLLLCISILSPQPSVAANKAATVLVLNSYHMGYLWGESVLEGIRDKLNQAKIPLKVHYEFMDTKQYSPAEIFPILDKLYSTKYKNTRFDAIIASDNNALDFLVRYRDKLFPNVPVAFCGVTRFSPQMLKGKSGFTGVAEEADIKETIELALTLFPQTRHLALVSGGVTTSSKNNLEQAKELAPLFADRLSFIELTKLNPPELQEKLTNLPERTAILYLSYYRTPDGSVLSVPESTSLVATSSGLPVFSPWQYTMGHGVLGGKMVSGIQQGQDAAQLALDILKGVPIADLPVIRRQQNEYIFDYRQLKKFKIPQNILPHSAKILFEPQTLFYKYKTLILIAIGCFLWLSITILVLLRMLREKNETTELLKREEERLESLLKLNEQEKNSADELVLFSLEKVRNLLNATTAVYLTITPEQKVDRYCISKDQNTSWHSLPEPLRINDLVSPWEKLVQREQTARLQAENSRTPVVWPLGMNKFKNSIALPIWEREQLRALIILGDDTVTFSKSDERQLTLMMQGVTNLIQKRRAREREAQLAAELRHSQKMEALGTVAGGIAHDFNNIIGAISSCCELALDDVPRDNPAHEDIKQALKAAYRGKQIIGQIRRFSSRTEVATEIISLPALTEECIQLLQTLLPSTIEIKFSSKAEHGGMLLADAGELHQVIMNLCLNADHAMFGMQGILTINIEEVDVTEENDNVPHELPNGQYLCLSVSDTGIGIPEELLPRIFDPFFTTKKDKGGTGLGLSTVHGIIKKYGGTVTVESKSNVETTFRVYLPEVAADSCAWSPEAEQPSTQGTEHILVVDDDEEMLYSVHKFLMRQGYTVTAQQSSAEALKRIQSNPTEFDLLLADQIMPELTGLELASAISTVAPDLRVIIYSGFEGSNVELFMQESDKIGISAFLAKPFRNSDLGNLIRNVLDSQQDGAPWP
ncbi:ABC transporter substrate binding protein [Halodesulfovibrio marinisediminis]|uniref:histidine kinase n=1 Tax=Halodesulfovibrio marinisediminis DSM 17456 TaxID=1121457 RepID=A0A1N6GSW0_9BACT|nr:ABC transporter substrate binding protein [Halodesulfovibrio marinisediminis]SIO10603.1 Signal transduction histidine kinase [Halodesulfovibrio marinisediminis DSM 17456]